MALDLHAAGVRRNPRYSLTPREVTADIVNSKYFTDPLELLGEKSFGSPGDIPDDEIGTPMQEFYRDKTIFLTGGTGFMGKTVVEKLLRSCPHLKHIYLLVRPKKGKDIQERLDAIFEDRLFWRLRAEVPDFRSKVSAVAGDCSLPGLGLSETDRATLVKQVNIVFHGAATVRFDEHIKMAVKINVCGVQAMLQLAREMKDLKAFVHVSTAFTHCPRERIDEEFYPVPLKYENLIQLISETGDEELSEMTPKLLHEWPNTYTFTKALAEDVLCKEGKGLPLAVLRPAVIVSTYREPVRGWIDNVYGPIGMLVGIATGVLHTHLINLNTVTDMVPVDLVVNSMISIAWSIGESGKVEKAINKIENNTDPIPIYNFVGSARNPISWGKLDELATVCHPIWPTIRAIWYFSFIPASNKYTYYILSFFLHTIPGFILDSLASLSGRKPMLMAIYKKIDKASDTLEYFAHRQWVWTDHNVQALFNKLDPEDQELFFFDMGQMKWEYYAEAMGLGLRVYLVHDDIHTLPAARKKYQRLYIAHCALKIFCGLLLLVFLLYIVQALFGI